MYYYLPLSLLFKAKESYALRAVSKHILKAKLTNVLQTMPNSQEKGLVRGLKVFVGVAFKLFDGT